MHVIALGEREIGYSVRPSSRARHMRLTVYPGGKVMVTHPMRANPKNVEKFMRAHAGWLLRTLTRLERQPARKLLPSGKREYAARKAEARKLVRERLAHLNRFYGFKFGRISIRNQRSRWGSCSKEGNLSFNFKIVHLSPEVADYIIVHELCHIKEMNHSRRFWALVAQTIPSYRSLRRELHGFSLQ